MTREFQKMADELGSYALKSEGPSPSPIEFRKVVEARRSVRVFDGKPIPESIVRDCLDLALLAPNSSNLQAWEFHWIRSENLRSEMIEACLSQPAAKTAGEFIVCVARTATWKDNARRMMDHFRKTNPEVPKSVSTYYEKIVPLVYGMGPLGLFGLVKKIAVFFVGLARPTPREPTSFSQLRLWAEKSTALACENLMLAFSSHGYDTCPMEGFDSKRVRKILDLPSDASVVMIISAGKRTPQGIYGPRVRFDSSLFIKER